jgi:hypothetical protein
MKKFKSEVSISNRIEDAAPANVWAHFKKNACCGKGGKTTNSRMSEKENG